MWKFTVCSQLMLTWNKNVHFASDSQQIYFIKSTSKICDLAANQ